ncbi:3-deoxy-D-manno-octulosonic acid transferase [Arenibacter aquaticus]|uniref:3-deoxy-D-manno-octulosonic acid transferase n=1 Tax=Arenibacter aquaticus TaxID=2489054 RepID=A0A430K7Y7_9FLAO|nr:glycosyltransferase N-terminal domain-containing protein [Arenibacter aquaticus]RTE55069.1 3-deoxy-D-manno-octulosonic acid transferase [Arenibacter aquaticus]
MFTIYNFAVRLTSFFLRILSLFLPKIKLFTEGRKEVFPYLQENIADGDQIIWVHTASLGEFEQGLPIIEKLRRHYPNYRILVSFFSPSGYEIKKNTASADLICYLPLDSTKNAKRFLKLVDPKLVVFVKYEIWPNYLRLLSAKKTPTLLISSIFKKNQIYFKSYGGFMRKALESFTHIFVQDSQSVQLLKNIDIENTTISGDTRFDRVMEILERDNSLDFMQRFKNQSRIMVAGSTWPEDEEVIVPYINSDDTSLKFVLAPHNIKSEHIAKLKSTINKKTILYSEIRDNDLADYKVLIVDTIGILTKIYSYADISYVGGGFATGLHNTLEPSVHGIPVIIGPKYQGFKEAEDLVALGGILVVGSKSEFKTVCHQLENDVSFLQKTGNINSSYVSKNKGASIQIIEYIRTLL